VIPKSRNLNASNKLCAYRFGPLNNLLSAKSYRAGLFGFSIHIIGTFSNFYVLRRMKGGDNHVDGEVARLRSSRGFRKNGTRSKKIACYCAGVSIRRIFKS